MRSSFEARQLGGRVSLRTAAVQVCSVGSRGLPDPDFPRYSLRSMNSTGKPLGSVTKTARSVGLR